MYCFDRAAALVLGGLPARRGAFVSRFYTRTSRAFSRSCSGARAMATFPAQKQESQPGVQHVMDPHPRTRRSDYKPSDKLKNKVALITGGDSGIGRAVAYFYSLEGASVAITYVPGKEEKDAEEAIHMIKEAKTAHAKDPIMIPGDIGYDENCKKIVDEVVKAYGRIDILVNNAAEQYRVQKIEDLKPEQLERVFRTNIFSHFYLSRYAVPHMKEGEGCIINTTSVNAYKGNKTLIDYTSTKGAIVGFTRSLALNLVDRGIRVNGVAPGPVWAPLIPASSPEPQQTEHFGEQCPMGKAAQPDDIAPSYVFLASEDAAFFTGQVLHPNGGMIVNA
ncbi:NADPH-dependent aldehyde reductase 1, chloroplastic [Selaginella moellendorffii]|uniref:NADPH-dependent aldehyde reductase 1, chloroplastic n=1 Tax=Selaginella moellendorffii TaxID=88036 RepID=UPI000D1C27CC|nr:NADPH-dependent aldehyde reductase 1, chloroplastic [Selaginella moellendorffii]|eukprot:XP_024527686.1 NADPH-dependent aldehyde reductase 1, chloroplastic [Selaginella moellendorffii]